MGRYSQRKGCFITNRLDEYKERCLNRKCVIVIKRCDDKEQHIETNIQNDYKKICLNVKCMVLVRKLVKMWRCIVCGFISFCRDDCKLHFNLHRVSDFVNCSLCNNFFKNQHELIRHRKNIHKFTNFGVRRRVFLKNCVY